MPQLIVTVRRTDFHAVPTDRHRDVRIRRTIRTVPPLLNLERNLMQLRKLILMYETN